MKRLHFLLLAASILLIFGCTSFMVSQSFLFMDGEGQVIAVDYGEIDGEHESTFRAPNGTEQEFKSKFCVEVVMPDGTKFRAYQCFNELLKGTLYRSDNGKWTYHAQGNVCTVYKRVEEKTYKPVFAGIVCRGDKKVSKEQRR